MSIHSDSLSGDSLPSTACGMPSLPMSCIRPARASTRSSAALIDIWRPMWTHSRATRRLCARASRSLTLSPRARTASNHSLTERCAGGCAANFDFLHPEGRCRTEACSTSTVGSPVLVAVQLGSARLPSVATIGEGYAIATLSESPSAAVGQLCGAAAAFFGWRWAFWVLLVVEGVLSLGAVFGLVGFTRSVDAAIGELLSLLNVAIFVWMIVAVAKFGPWAMKRPGT